MGVLKNGVILIGLVASGCNQGNPRICSSIAPRKLETPKTAQDQYEVMVSCIDNWSRRLAKSPQDAAQEVADAALGGCQDTVGLYVSMSEKEGQPTEGVEAISAYMRRHALFVAVQTRAGDCPLPSET
jgi:hypothetical protein